MPGTRKLGRTSDSRNAMLRAMVTYLFENGKIETTVTRAKEVRSWARRKICIPSVRCLPISPRRLLRRRLSMRSAPSMLIATVATPASSRLAFAAAMPLRWPSSSWCNPPLIAAQNW